MDDKKDSTGYAYLPLPFVQHVGEGDDAQFEVHCDLIEQAVACTKVELIIGLETIVNEYTHKELSTLLHRYYNFVSMISFANRGILYNISIVFIDPNHTDSMDTRVANQISMLQTLLLPSSKHITSHYIEEHTIERFNSLRDDAKLPRCKLYYIGEPNTTLKSSSSSNNNNNQLITHDHCVIGGTFDNLHTGHKVLLSMAALVSNKTLAIGLSIDELLKNKKYLSVLDSYDERKEALIRFIHLINSNIQCKIDPLSDIYGCSLWPNLTCLILTNEPKVLENGPKVNSKRMELGLNKLDILAVDLAGFHDEESVEKISSGNIREIKSARQNAEIMILEYSWDRLFVSLTSSISDLSSKWYNIIKTYYSQEHRYYHTLHHVASMLRLAEEYKVLIKKHNLMLVAIWFHDIIYDPTKNNNEEKSADLCREFCKEIKMNNDDIDIIYKWIIATKTHKLDDPNDTDLAYFLDFDMEILSSSPTRYFLYSQQIRKEYIHVSEPEYIEQRGNIFLKKLLESNVYYTLLFESANLIAKYNANQEMKRLIAKL